MNELKFLYEDDDILVCHKPAGMATEGAKPGQMDVISAARNFIARRNRENKGGRQRDLPPYIASVNRLDKPVEGVLVLAKNKKAASSLADQIKKRDVKKYYYALCYGIPDTHKETISDYIVRREDTKKAFIVTKQEAESYKDESITLKDGSRVRLIGGSPKKADLTYEIVRQTEKTALLSIHLGSGRFHQIRAQMAFRGFPIVADNDYGSRESLEYAKSLMVKDICLAAYRYEIIHPVTGRSMSFQIKPENSAIRMLLDV